MTIELKAKIQEKVAALTQQLINYRRHLHQHPELSFKEYETAAFVKNILSEAGITHQACLATGVVAIIPGKNPDKQCIALRGDMDALPIEEKNEVAYKSKNDGVMHACGHDVHTTCLLGAALVLNEMRDDFEGSIKLIFQPGEEVSPGGANLMIQEGVLNNPKVDGIIGLHVFPEFPVGILGFRAGEYMASSDEIYITVNGKGGHAALPHKCIDPILIASAIVLNLQQVVSRRTNALLPTVLSFGKIQGGHTNNVIPDTVVLEGTLRTFDEQWRSEALQLIEKISSDTAAAYGGTVDFQHPPGYPSLYNDIAFTNKICEGLKEFWGANKVLELDRRLTAEDFSFYTHHTKGCFFRLGTNTNNLTNNIPVHNSLFDIDERAINIGVTSVVYGALVGLSN